VLEYNDWIIRVNLILNCNVSFFRDPGSLKGLPDPDEVYTTINEYTAAIFVCLVDVCIVLLLYLSKTYYSLSTFSSSYNK